MSSIRYVKSKDPISAGTERQRHALARSDIETALASIPSHVGRHLASTGREPENFWPPTYRIRSKLNGLPARHLRATTQQNFTVFSR
jgi:hypothetical protein